LTDVGHRRQVNDDAIVSAPAAGGLLFAVADGVSGLPGARRASQTALKSFIGALAGVPDRKPIHKRLRAAAEQANVDVHDQARSDPALRSMRTTLTATAIVGDALAAVHVGDCRLYLLRRARLECLTRDHRSLLQHHVLTRCLGADPLVRVDVVRKRLQYGDVLLQCSDGLYNAVSAPRIAMVLASEPRRPRVTRSPASPALAWVAMTSVSRSPYYMRKNREYPSHETRGHQDTE
jgi:serine/threonine protein phosphatase PrpC